MVNIGNFRFIELKKEKVKEDYSRSVNPNITFGLMTNMTAQNSFMTCAEPKKCEVVSNDVTDHMSTGKFDFKTDYAIVYLYDYNNDFLSRKFISEYGGDLHNITSDNYTILTLYSEDMIRTWDNIHHREKLNPSKRFEERKVRKMVEQLSDIYNITKLPAMIVIHKNKDEEESFNIDLSNEQDTASIYAKFEGVINTITRYCERDFIFIAQQVSNINTTVKSNKGMNEFAFDSYIETLVEKETEINPRYGITTLASELGYKYPKSFYNHRMKPHNFPRDHVLYIAIRFKISTKDLDWLLHITDHSPLMCDGRDGIIRYCLSNGFDVDKTENELVKNKAKGIKPKTQKE